jgi:peptide/nickel transport system permease protein
MKREAMAGLIVLAVLVTAALAAPLCTAYGPDVLDLAHRRAAPSSVHWFGTDDLGRDLLTRVLFGARVSLAVGLLSAVVAGAVGITLGGTAAYAGGWVDEALMRVTDGALAVPRLLLLMVAAAILQPSIPLLVCLIGLAGWMETARVTRAEFVSLGRREFVDAARALGAGHVRLLVGHLLRNAAPAVAVSLTIAVGRSILVESALSFFGVGVQPPAASWGNMLYQAQSSMATEPWLALAPGMFIFITALATNAVGEGIVA